MSYTLFDLAQKIELVLTCEACPEQYEAFIDGKQIGYLRLRHGYFYAAYPDVGGEVVYSADTIGDGMFDDSEREKHLVSARLRLINKHYEVLQNERD